MKSIQLLLAPLDGPGYLGLSTFLSPLGFASSDVTNEVIW